MDIITLVKNSVRDSKFDFRNAASLVNKAIENGEVPSHQNKVTEKEVREIFAAEFDGNDNQNTKKKSNDTSSSLALLSDENIPTTIQDALDFQKQLNLNAMEQKKEIFSRVLNSLSGDDNLAATMTLSKEITEILEERKLQEEEKRIKDEKERKEKEMDDYLKQQKQRLLSRFNPDSEDSQGINPLADIDAYENQPKNDNDNGMLLLNPNSSSEVHSGMIDMNNNNINNDDDVDIATNVFQINDLLANPAFDAVLEEVEAQLALERESQNAAPSKADDGSEYGSSELAEVLKILDAEAEANAKLQKAKPKTNAKAKAKTSNMSNLPPPPPVQQQNKKQPKQNNFKKKELGMEKKNVKQATNTNTKTPSATSASTSAPVEVKPVSRGPAAAKDDKYGRVKRSGTFTKFKNNNNSGSSSDKKMEKKNGSDHEEEDDDDEGDDDWMANRRKLKEKSLSVPEASATGTVPKPAKTSVWIGSAASTQSKKTTSSSSKVEKKKVGDDQNKAVEANVHITATNNNNNSTTNKKPSCEAKPKVQPKVQPPKASPDPSNFVDVSSGGGLIASGRDGARTKKRGGLMGKLRKGVQAAKSNNTNTNSDGSKAVE